MHFVQGFEYRVREAAATGEAFLDARDNCHGAGLDLCSEEQWEILCSEVPRVGALETWTTSFTPAGNFVTRGGSGCDSAGEAPPEQRSAGRIGLCCERRAGIELVETRKQLARSAQTYMAMVEDAMNSRDVQETMRLLGEEAFLYNRNTFKDRARLEKELTFDVKNNTEFSNRLVRCSSRIFNAGQEGEFTCDTVSSRKLVTRDTRELAMFTSSFRFAPPMLKYREWAVGTNFARQYKPVQ